MCEVPEVYVSHFISDAEVLRESESNFKPDAHKTTLAEELLLVAIDDLNVAKRLYDGRQYAQCIFHLQQAVEKTGKAYSLALGLEEDPKSMGHQVAPAYIKIMERFPAIAAELDSVGVHTTQNFNETIAVLSRKRSPSVSRAAFRSEVGTFFSKLSLDEMAALMAAADRGSNAVQFELEDLKEVLTQKSSGIVGRQLSQDETIRVRQSLNRVDGELTDCASKIMGFASGLSKMFVLSVLLDPHYISTRHPDKNLNLRPSDYVVGLGIVDAIPLLIENIEFMINGFQSFIISVHNLKQSTLRSTKNTL